MAAMHIDYAGGQHRKMLAEAMQIVMRLWTEDEPFTFEGEFWTVSRPDYVEIGEFGPFLKPFTQPHPRLALSSFTPRSQSLKLAGERGYIPLSLQMAPRHLAEQWEMVEEGAAKSGRTADRGEWRLLREVVVADTDAEAERLALEGPGGLHTADYFLPAHRSFNNLDMLKHDPSVPDDDVTVEYVVKNNWLVGSPETVAEKIDTLYGQVGGFGHLMFYTYDYYRDQSLFKEIIGRLSSEVLPKVSSANLTSTSAD